MWSELRHSFRAAVKLGMRGVHVRYGGLRVKIERMQTYRTGDFRRSLARTAGFLAFWTLCTAVGGPIGLVVAPIA